MTRKEELVMNLLGKPGSQAAVNLLAIMNAGNAQHDPLAVAKDYAQNAVDALGEDATMDQLETKAQEMIIAAISGV